MSILKTTLFADFFLLAQQNQQAVVEWRFVAARHMVRFDVTMAGRKVSRQLDQSPVHTFTEAQSITRQMVAGLLEAGFAQVITVPPLKTIEVERAAYVPVPERHWKTTEEGRAIPSSPSIKEALLAVPAGWDKVDTSVDDAS